jgi:transposase
MRIVMAFDRHREQIAFDALNTATGEVSRGRVRPADRLGFRRWPSRWDGEEIEAALEATTGWRFMVEELRAVGAEVHLAEPAETSALRGPKKRAKTDRQDARRLRELLQAGRVPESWIPPEHVLELRSKVRLRHTLQDQRGEWQQRIQAQLYHHGVPRRRQLLVGERRAWLEALELPDAARRQIDVALRMIDASTPSWSRSIASCGRSPAASPAAGPCRPTTGSARSPRWRSWPSSATSAASHPRATRSATPAWTSPSPNRIAGAAPATSRGRARRRCAGRCSRPPRSRAARARPTATTTPRPPLAWAAIAPALSVARRLLKRSYHTLRELGEEALQPA